MDVKNSCFVSEFDTTGGRLKGSQQRVWERFRKEKARGVECIHHSNFLSTVSEKRKGKFYAVETLGKAYHLLDLLVAWLDDIAFRGFALWVGEGCC